MALVVWDESLSVQIDEIDAEHQRLIKMLNDLDQAMRKQQGREVVDAIIDGLIDYAKIHFRNEETYFERYGYPDAEAHKQEHASFIVQAFQFKRDYDQGKLMLSIEILDFLIDWLREHIKGSDQRYAEFLRQQDRRRERSLLRSGAA
jgi:hemerythrin